MKVIIKILLIGIYSIGFTQTPMIKWQQCYGTSETEYTNGIEILNDGYLIAIEVSIDDPNLTNYHGSSDIWIINLDSIGNIVWEKCYGGSAAESPIKLIKKNENEFFIFGYAGSTDGDVQSGNNGYSDIWVVKINEQGEIIWENTYGCTGYDNPRDMILTPDDGFLMIDRIGIGGGDVTNFYGVGDNWMCKCDSLGNIEWEKTLGNFGLDNCVSLIINSENNIMMIGAAQKHGDLVECYPDEAWGDLWLVELDLQGNILSQHCYGGSDYDLGFFIIELEDGYIFCGTTTSNDGDVSGLHGPPGGPPAGWEDIWIVRLNEQFEILWQKCIGGYNGDYPSYFTKTLDGGFIVIGYTFSHDGDVTGNHSWMGGYYNDIWVVKLTSGGEIEWDHCYGGENDESVYNYSIFKKGDYNYVISAQAVTNSYDVQCNIQGNGFYDAWVFEIDSLDTTGVIENHYDKELVKVYPNPAEEFAVFEVQSSRFNVQGGQSESSIVITDVFGQRVAELNLKNEKTVWDCRDIQPGIYFYNLKTNGKSYPGKLLITR